MITVRIVSAGRSLIAAAVMAAVAALGAPPVHANSTVSIGVVNDFAGWNPYADSTAQMYMIWCQTYGCLGTFDTRTGDYEGILAERWEVSKDNPNEWTFYLKKGIKRHNDGKELTAEDVIHSLWRNKNDPRTAQANNTRPVVKAVAVDKYTVKFFTKQPTAPLLSFLFDRLIITGKDLYEKHGQQVDRKAPWGYGPYQVKDVIVGQRMVLEKNGAWPGIKKENPDRLIFLRIKEDEARVTALLNGELQLAQFIPPHLVDRVKSAPGVTLKSTSPVEVMFLAMNPNFKPWDNKKVRQAVAYAIDREAIVKAIFRGGAEVLHGPIGPGQYGYTSDVEPKYEYNPEKAKQLLKEAGYANGVEIDFYSAANRYINDRQSSEAIVPMLQAVGFKVRLHTPEYSSHWPLVRKGKRPFYYQGRGSVVDPSAMLVQYFGTGGTPRIGYSNPELDALLEAQEREFDTNKRRALLAKAFNIVQEDAPAFFLWRIQQHYGISNRIEFNPMSTDRVYGVDIQVRN
jgi:peptide/nickel transport system substrate-binding protein